MISIDQTVRFYARLMIPVLHLLEDWLDKQHRSKNRPPSLLGSLCVTPARSRNETFRLEKRPLHHFGEVITHSHVVGEDMRGQPAL